MALLCSDIDLFDRNKTFVTFSQVKRRMILMARAMIKHPPLLILDEPSTGLADKSASMLSALINKMAKEGNTAILYVSHRMEPGLTPEYVYQLTPTENGSTGTVLWKPELFGSKIAFIYILVSY